MNGREAPQHAEPRFRSSGQILCRQREDGTVWCPRCRAFLPPTRFARSRGGFKVYCHTCHDLLRQERLSRKPDVYARQLARQRAYYQRVEAPRTQERRQEHRQMTLVALDRLRAIGLRSKEIARLTGISERAMVAIRNPSHMPFRPTMDRILALFRAASDIPVGKNRPSTWGTHEFYAVLARRMVEPLAEIEAERKGGKYKKSVGA